MKVTLGCLCWWEGVFGVVGYEFGVLVLRGHVLLRGRY